MKKYGIKVETFQAAGRYQHRVFDIGVKPDRVGEVRQDIVEAQKRVNEKAWDLLPDGAKGLVATIQYKVPKK